MKRDRRYELWKFAFEVVPYMSTVLSRNCGGRVLYLILLPWHVAAIWLPKQAIGLRTLGTTF